MTYVATISLYQKTGQLLPLKARTLENAYQEAYDRIFLQAMNQVIPDDYDGSTDKHWALMKSVTPEAIKAFMEKLTADKRNNVGDLINAISMVPNTIKIMEVYAVHNCEKSGFHQKWCEFFAGRYKELATNDKQLEIDRIKQKMAEDAKRLKELEGK